jgi:gamma-glutamyltranspeptidase
MIRSVRFCSTAVALAVGTAVAGLAVRTPLAAQQRPEVHGNEAAVVADHPLAAAAGADVLRRGGNAVDAAVTMAAVLAVVRPHMNGLGGDAFALIRDGRSGRVRALNGSGRSGAGATPAAFRALGYDAMPGSGVHSVTVPGAVGAWAEALRRHGTIDLAAALQPAIGYATRGFVVSEKLAADIAAARGRIESDSAMAAVFLPGGQPPEAGSVLRQPDLARSLSFIARSGAGAMYTGDIATSIARFMAAENGLIGAADLAEHSSTWQEPIATDYEGHRILQFPPNTQGVALLMQMNMAAPFDLRALGHNHVDYIHTLVEIWKLAAAERDRHITDPAFAEIPLDRLLSPEYARALLESWRTVEPTTAVDTTPRVGATPHVGTTPHVDTTPHVGTTSHVGTTPHDDGDTVFLAVVDAQGNAVSMIQSLFSSFGSGRMVPGTGIVLHNRGGLFSLEPRHINIIAPRKRTYHTLAPAMALRRDGSLFMTFGTPGGDGQMQTLLQVFNNVALFRMTPQRAVEAPRWRLHANGRLQIEDAVSAATRDELIRFGHTLLLAETGVSADLGGAQIILVTPAGAKLVGADPRREAYGIAW